jgi:hypothetical protein
MATLFVDFENGNDDYAGSSFALLASGSDGFYATTNTRFTSASANFPDDGSLINQYISHFSGTSYRVYAISARVSSTQLTITQISGGDALPGTNFGPQPWLIGGRWKSLTNGATTVRIAPGDTVRIMGSPAPTSLGQNGVWTSQALQATKSISSSTNATPISITCTSHGYSTGDTVVITNHTINTNANGTWEITSTGANTFTLDGSAGNGVGGASGTVRLRNNSRVMLTTAVTQNIASTGPGRAAWTVSANCLHAFNTAFSKEHTSSDAITLNTAFTTGKAAYYALPSTLDLSSYWQVSFWLYMSGDDLLAGEAELRLCSDSTGDTVVDTIPIPYTPGSRLRPITWDKGSALGSSIASISLYINIDLSTTGNVAMMFSNIIACKASSAADSLTLTSLIGKNTTGETFWGIQSINGRRVMLDADTNASPASTAVRGYYGTSGTVETWKRETIKLGPAGSTTALQTIQDQGTDGSPITFSGGWDRTSMSTQNLETWLDGVNGNGYGIEASASPRSWIALTKLAGVRFNNFARLLRTTGQAGWNVEIIAANNNAIGLNCDYLLSTVRVIHACSNSSTGVNLSSFTGGRFYLDGGALSNAFSGVIIAGSVQSLGSGGTLANNGASGLSLGGTTLETLIYKNAVFQDNSSGSINLQSVSGQLYLVNCSLVDSTELFSQDIYRLATVNSHNHDQTAGNHKIFMAGALISAATDQRKTASGISWKIQPTSTSRSSAWPVVLSLAKVACAANSLVTVKAWMHRDNSGLEMRLVCKGGQIAGVANDVTASVTTTNAWEEETITFTPTEVGVVEITAEAWGGTTFSGWVDDMTISQA